MNKKSRSDPRSRGSRGGRGANNTNNQSQTRSNRQQRAERSGKYIFWFHEFFAQYLFWFHEFLDDDDDEEEERNADENQVIDVKFTKFFKYFTNIFWFDGKKIN